MHLRDSVALITGTSRGLGLEVAKAFARQRARLVLTARDGESLERAVRAVRADARDAVG
ncbi:MAG TPA: SDR family NAD(P)-dependent oxidoreductase, partial [bacterium]|nr:SDR family NAD(P)-dependent oxidoreductase [bacterium]